MGVHPQKQPGLYFVGMCVPAGRMQAQDLHEIARLAETYGDGTVRLTCEENVLLVNVPESKLEALRAEPLLKRFQLDPGTLTKGMVTCTGSQFCGFALTETKNKAISVRKRASLDSSRICAPDICCTCVCSSHNITKLFS